MRENPCPPRSINSNHPKTTPFSLRTLTEEFLTGQTSDAYRWAVGQFLALRGACKIRSRSYREYSEEKRAPAFLFHCCMVRSKLSHVTLGQEYRTARVSKRLFAKGAASC